MRVVVEVLQARRLPDPNYHWAVLVRSTDWSWYRCWGWQQGVRLLGRSPRRG